MVVVLIYTVGFRTGGFDYDNYKNGFEWNSFKEPFFRILVTSLHKIGATYRVIFIIASALPFLITYKYIKETDSSLYWLTF